jgi:WD40 repeat protein
LYAFVHDAKRFALHNTLVIEQTPLQSYCSALIFTPLQSIVRVAFEKCIPSWIQTKPKVQERWDALLQTLEGHSSMVTSVAFSPDGKLRALSALDNWIVEDGVKILWLPPNYRATSTTVWNNIIALGHSSGRLSILDFKEGPKLI